ncbi:MAG: PVC-type heme-binding CxxCH protein [Isosphaeraceae bacterium]
MRFNVRRLVFLAICAFASRGDAQDDLARELPRIKPLEPAAALKSFRIHEGFHLEAVAVEPLVTGPVSACYDAEGRLYVVEMRGYPYPENSPTGNVVRLEDRDHDGRFDARTVLVSGLSWPTGVVPYDGGVFIAVAPDILYAKDTSGDGVADVQKVMFTGLGTGNVQGLVNGLLWGPDGWIYGCASSNDGEIKNLTRPEAKPVSVRGRDFRFRPDGSKFEAISGGGQFGHSFDDWGHRFTCSNSNHIRQIVLPAHDLERNPALVAPVVLDIAAEGPAAPVFRISAAEPWRIVRTRQRAADPVLRKRLPSTELFATGFFTSATGLTIYRGSAYPAAYRGNAFVGDVGGNLVHRKRLSVQGATYLATRADRNVEFLASTDNWFRPVNFANTPQGTLLILDMYRETIEHPESIPEPIKKHLDLTSGRDRGRLYELVHESPAKRSHRRPHLTKATSAELVNLLADPDAWWRETAQRLLLERGDASSAALLRELAVRRPNALARLHALWTLDALGSLDAAELILGLNDPESRVREQSARLAEPRIAHDPRLFAALLALADDSDPFVRFQTALSLGETGDDPRTAQALARIAAQAPDDRWTRIAVLSSIGKQGPKLLEVLAKKQGFLDTDSGKAWLEEMAALIGAGRDPAQLKRMIAQFTESGRDPDLAIRVVVALDQGTRWSGTSLARLLGEDEAKLMSTLAVRARTIAESDASPDRRLPAIALLGTRGGKPALAVLPGLLDARQPEAVQIAALRALDEQNDPSVGRLVVGQWKSLSPAVRREAAELLFRRRDRLKSLLDALEAKTLTASEIDPDRLRRLREHRDTRIRGRARKILGAEPAASRDRKAIFEAYRAAIALNGRVERGRAVFQKTCATCHRVRGEGIEVGPDLATVAGRTPEDLLLHILDPNREVAANFVNYNVATTDGRTISGIIAAESATALTLKRAQGVTDVIPRPEIEAVRSTGLSLMPEGLEKGLTPQDLADLMAYVRSIQGPASAP